MALHHHDVGDGVAVVQVVVLVLDVLGGEDLVDAVGPRIGVADVGERLVVFVSPVTAGDISGG
jgi:hypothetical protein